MLVLSRKRGERLRLELPDGRAVWVEVVLIDGNRVKIGIAAPPDVKVWHAELVEAKTPGGAVPSG